MEDILPNFNKAKRRTLRGSGLFNSIPQSVEASPISPSQTEYEKQLEREISEWIQLIKEKRKLIRPDAQSPQTVDKSILNKEQKIYCDFAPDFDKFIKESDEFCKYAAYFMKTQEKYLDKRTNFDEFLDKQVYAESVKFIESTEQS